MTGLLWWSGITWDTPMRDIGWVWVVLVLLVIELVRLSIQLWREFRVEGATDE